MNARIKNWITRLPFPWVWPRAVMLQDISVLIRKSAFGPGLRRHLMRGGYESAERELVDLVVRPGDQILEIGASAGVLTCFLAKRSGENGRVVSVEANPTLEPFFQAQLAENHVEAAFEQVLCCPIWEDEVPDAITRLGFSEGENNLMGVVSETAGKSGVPWRTAKTVCDQHGLKPNVMMIDIEGAESVWLESPPRFPPSLTRLIVEFHPFLHGAEMAENCIQAVLDEGFGVLGVQNTVMAFGR